MKNNTDSTSKQKKLLTIIAVLLLSLVIFAAPFTGVTFAKAQEPAPDNPTRVYNKLFWFTDNSDSQTYFQQLVSAFPQINMQRYYKDTEVFCSVFMNEFSADEFSDVEDAYVIFEIQYGMDYWLSEEGCVLYDVFNYFDENNCKIMFVCGTDESRFYNQNDFLNFVDIHINTDLFTTFFTNFFVDVQSAYGEPEISYVTFFIDSYLSEDIENGYLSSWFFKNYFMRFILSIYREEIELGGQSVYNILLANNIKVICDLGSGWYYDFVNQQRFRENDYEELYDRYLDNNKIYAIGDTRLGYELSYDWYSLVEDLKEYCNEDKFEVYVYNEAQYTFYGSFVYTIGARAGLFSQILSDFIYGNNLITYDNWSGKCIVTHKDIPQSSGGWIRDFGLPDQDSSFAEKSPYLGFLDAWQIVLSTEVKDGHLMSDYVYYTTYHNQY